MPNKTHKEWPLYRNMAALSLGNQTLACHHRATDSITSDFMRVSWWTQWHRTSVFTPISSILPLHHTHISPLPLCLTALTTHHIITPQVFKSGPSPQILHLIGYEQGPDFDDLKMSEKWSIKWPKIFKKWAKIFPISWFYDTRTSL
jgi:hypothetical protein